MKKTICIIGKGHSGTGLITEIFHKSGVFMGEIYKDYNDHFDRMPHSTIYKIMSLPVGYQHGHKLNHISPVVKQATNNIPNTEWDFTKMVKDEIPPQFISEMKGYLEDLDKHDGETVGWKMTESNLVYPWLVRLYPDWYYIHIVRDVRDILSRAEASDTDEHTNLFNIPDYKSYGMKKNDVDRYPIVQAINWKYQLDIVKSIKAKNYMRITLEDLVMNQDDVLNKLSDFVKFKLTKVSVNQDVVESWRDRDCGHRIYSKYCIGTSNKYDISMDWNSIPKSKNSFIVDRINGEIKGVHTNYDDGFPYSFLNDYMEEFKYPDWPKYGDNIQYRRKGG